MKSKTKPLERPPVVKDAYSYIRFSSKKQAEGASLERQLTGTRKYCEENNLILNETLTFQDLGVSAFNGDNLNHSLGELFRACEDGLIPKGSALVVEALDRLSRRRARVVATLLGRLLDDYGLEVHLTGIKKVLYPESVSAAEEGMDLLYVTMLAIRASEEQETKAGRLNHAFESKRNKVKNGETLLETHENKLPWWVVYNPETGKLESPPERAETVKQIFVWAAEGVTSPEIARRLDAKGTPTWRPRATHWSSSRIRHMVLSKSAEGVLESTARSKARGHDFKVNEYYPVLVDATLATRARTAMTANSRYGRGNSVPTSDKSERPHNLLRGLLKVEGHPARYDCRRNGTQGNWIGYYYGYDEVARKNLGVVSSKLLEPTLLAGLRELTVEMVKPEANEVDPAVSALAHAQRRLTEAGKSLDRILAAIERGGELDSLLKRLSSLEKEKADLAEKVEQLDRKVRSTQAAGSGEAELAEMKTMLDVDLGDNAMRARLGQAIRRVITRIEVSFKTNRDIACVTVNAALGRGDTMMVCDPCPPKKTRKPLYILVYFRHGGKRSIIRFPAEPMAKLKHPNMLVTSRV